MMRLFALNNIHLNYNNNRIPKDLLVDIHYLKEFSSPYYYYYSLSNTKEIPNNCRLGIQQLCHY